MFSTPIRGVAKRQTSRDSSNSNAPSRRSSLSSDNRDDLSAEEADQQQQQQQYDESFDFNNARSLSSWKKLKQKARTRFKGSVLRRSTDRGDHLRRLFLKRKMSESFRQSMSPRITQEKDDDETMVPRDFRLSSVGVDVLDESAEYDETFLPSKYDESLLEEIRNEVEAEYNREIESARIQEIENIQKDYRLVMRGYNELPLEVRLRNVSYTVPVDERKNKIQTVYNASCLYPVFKFYKRRVVKSEPLPEPRIVNKQVLHNISLVLKPGRQYLVLGPPGSGKGTQAAKLIDQYSLVHISTGDLFRYEMGNNTPLGLQAKAYMAEGRLVPDEVTIGMLRNKVEAHPEAQGFIFDGFPRTIPQAEALDALLEGMDTGISGLIALEVDDEEIVGRILNRGVSSGRPDDNDEAIIRKRITVYKQETTPVFDYYAQNDKSFSIPGVGSVEDIFGRLCTTIDQL